MKIAVFKEFKDPEVLKKLPEGLSLVQASESQPENIIKGNEETIDVLGKNAKLFTVGSSDEEIEKMLSELEKLGFAVVQKEPKTPTGM